MMLQLCRNQNTDDPDNPLVSCMSLVKHSLRRALAAAIVVVHISSPLPYFRLADYSVPPAKAVLYSPDTKVPRTGELALRRAIPANTSMKAIQVLIHCHHQPPFSGNSTGYQLLTGLSQHRILWRISRICSEFHKESRMEQWRAM